MIHLLSYFLASKIKIIKNPEFGQNYKHILTLSVISTEITSCLPSEMPMEFQIN